MVDRLLRAGMLVVVAVALAACSAIVKPASDPLKQAVAADEGTVVLSLSINTGEVRSFGAVHIRKVTPGYSSTRGLDRFYYLVSRLPFPARDTSVFIGAVPAGNYEIVQLTDLTTQKFLYLENLQREIIGTFKVEAGRTTDLGRLIMTSANFKVVTGRSETLLSNRELVTRFVPNTGKLFAQPTLPGWNLRHEPELDVAERYGLYHPVGAGGFSELPGGEIIGGSRLGAIVKRDSSGRWSLLAHVPTRQSVLATVPYSAGQALAIVAGELSTLYEISRDRKLRRIDTGDLPLGNLVFIDRDSKASQWIIGLQTRDELALYRSATLDRGHWEKLRGDKLGVSFWTGPRSVWIWRFPGGVGFASSNSRRVACYRYAGQEWKEHGTPNDRVPISLNASAAGIGLLTGSGGLAGVFASTYYSRDCGAHWTNANSPYTVKVSAPLVLAAGQIIESGGVFGDAGLQGSSNGGKTWSKYSSDPGYTDSVWSLGKAGLFSISRGEFGVEDVRHSSDNGKTWNIELSSFDSDLYNRQKKKDK